jgi:hypothetical protein
MYSNSDSNRLWMSRLSFGVAIVALGSLVCSGCDSSTERTTGTRAEPVTVKAQPGAPAGEAAKEPAKAVEATKPSVVPAVAEAKSPAPSQAEQGSGEESSAKESPKAEPSKADLAGTLTVKRLTMTGEIKDREPTEAASFSVGGGDILAFLELQNEADVDQTVVVTFERDEKKVGFVELTVPAKQPRWRTWGKTKNIRSPGEWTAVVSTQDGTELSRTTFEVGEAAVPAG